MRNQIQKLIGRDVSARWERLTSEHEQVVQRYADLSRQVEGLSRTAESVERKRLDLRRNADLARVASLQGGNEDRIDSFLSQLTERATELEANSALIERETSAIHDEMKPLHAELDRIASAATRLESARRKQMRTVLLATLISELLTLGTTVAIAHGTSSGTKLGFSYYSAVCTILPVLLVAGFVEVAVIGGPFGLLRVANFSLPAFAGIGAALYVLASNERPGIALGLTIWGLFATAINLMLQVVLHVEVHDLSSSLSPVQPDNQVN
jgi:uncharacterized protein YfcZ (UPF0381/DUF406 family)